MTTVAVAMWMVLLALTLRVLAMGRGYVQLVLRPRLWSMVMSTFVRLGVKGIHVNRFVASWGRALQISMTREVQPWSVQHVWRETIGMITGHVGVILTISLAVQAGISRTSKTLRPHGIGRRLQRQVQFWVTVDVDFSSVSAYVSELRVDMPFVVCESGWSNGNWLLRYTVRTVLIVIISVSETFIAQFMPFCLSLFSCEIENKWKASF